jgi:hypothetical protein
MKIPFVKFSTISNPTTTKNNIHQIHGQGTLTVKLRGVFFSFLIFYVVCKYSRAFTHENKRFVDNKKAL